MEKKILNGFEEAVDGRKIWYHTPDPNFIELSKKSRVPHHWLSYDLVKSGKYSDAPIKPINGYVQNIYHEPQVIGISGNTVTIRFFLSADIYLREDPEEDNGFYNVDRLWMRQYYLSGEHMQEFDSCYPGTFKFFVPWFVDQTGEVEYLNVDDSHFVVQNKKDMWFTPDKDSVFVMPHMVLFRFKKIKINKEFYTIDKGTPMFDMKVAVSDIILSKIKESNANN